MINLFKQFFSFEKLMKDRLVALFFFLGLVVIGLNFFGTIMHAFGIMDHQFFKGLGILIVALFTPLFLFVGLRLICELMVALFEINDNLAPDGGKSNTADIDPFETARDAANKAAHSASEATKSVVEKTKTKINERKNSTDEGADDYADYEDTPPPKPIVKKTVRKRSVKKAAPAPKVYTKKPAAKKAVKKKPAAKKPTAKKAAPKKKTPPKK